MIIAKKKKRTRTNDYINVRSKYVVKRADNFTRNAVRPTIFVYPRCLQDELRNHVGRNIRNNWIITFRYKRRCTITFNYITREKRAGNETASRYAANRDHGSGIAIRDRLIG